MSSFWWALCVSHSNSDNKSATTFPMAQQITSNSYSVFPIISSLPWAATFRLVSIYFTQISFLHMFSDSAVLYLFNSSCFSQLFFLSLHSPRTILICVRAKRRLHCNWPFVLLTIFFGENIRNSSWVKSARRKNETERQVSRKSSVQCGWIFRRRVKMRRWAVGWERFRSFAHECRAQKLRPSRRFGILSAFRRNTGKGEAAREKSYGFVYSWIIYFNDASSTRRLNDRLARPCFMFYPILGCISATAAGCSLALRIYRQQLMREQIGGTAAAARRVRRKEHGMIRWYRSGCNSAACRRGKDIAFLTFIKLHEYFRPFAPTLSHSALYFCSFCLCHGRSRKFIIMYGSGMKANRNRIEK